MGLIIAGIVSSALAEPTTFQISIDNIKNASAGLNGRVTLTYQQPGGGVVSADCVQALCSFTVDDVYTMTLKASAIRVTGVSTYFDHWACTARPGYKNIPDNTPSQISIAPGAYSICGAYFENASVRSQTTFHVTINQDLNGLVSQGGSGQVEVTYTPWGSTSTVTTLCTSAASTANGCEYNLDPFSTIELQAASSNASAGPTFTNWVCAPRTSGDNFITNKKKIWAAARVYATCGANFHLDLRRSH